MELKPQQPITLIHQAISMTLGLQKGKKSPLSPIATAIIYNAHTKKLQITDIAKTFDIKKSTASGYVDNLEKKGYVIRQKDPQNRRNTYVVATEKSATLIRANEKVLADYIEKHMSHLSPQEQKQFIALLAKFVQD